MSAGRCTWYNCREGAVHQEVDRDGSPWAALCQFHHDKLEAACRNKEMGKVLGIWVLAQGGPKAAAARMMRRRYEP